MKQALLSLISGACIAAITASPAIAQPTLTAATAVPTAGITVRVLFTNNSTAATVSGNSGANQIWDLSGPSFTRRTDTLNFYSCNNGDDCGRYPGTTILSSHSQSTGGVIDGVVRDYYAGSNTTLSRIGNKDSVSGTAFHHIFTNPQDILHFPMTFNSGFVDAFAIIDTASGTTTHFKTGSDTVSADGWGTLKTPSGTFANTLRVKEIIDERDSSRPIGGTTTVTASSYVVYSWYDAAHPFALAQTEEYPGGPGTTIWYASYAAVPGTVTSVVALKTAGFTFSLAPNPVHGDATLSLSLPVASDLEVTVTDVTGRVAHREHYATMIAGDHAVTLPTQSLSPGLYIVRLNTDAATVAAKLIVE